jgi:serine/threonine protein kinase
MTTLRHPNVVLFMAASTKAPRMCIVMEYMSLGSLYEVRHDDAWPCDAQADSRGDPHLHRGVNSPCASQLLHNELIGKIPFELKAKMAYQGAKGMHFLHSSGTIRLFILLSSSSSLLLVGPLD